MSNRIERPEGTAEPQALDADVPRSAPREVNNTVVDQLMTAAFGRPRNPRSKEYTDGSRALLERKVNSVPLKCPYRMGTVQADAWFAGTDEGHLIWRDFQSSTQASEMGDTTGSDSHVKDK
jgi:hypothetical protein